MIVLFTDFGVEGPYLGQVKAVLWQHAPMVPVIDLFADAPAQRPRESAYLLAAYAGAFPPGCVFLGVVDPGVGGERRAVAARVDGRWLVGPDNGLFELMLRRGDAAEQFVIAPPSAGVSASFHGRDVFAPIAGRLAALNKLDAPRSERPFDESTRGLLRAFQAKQNLKADGVAGPRTYMRLNQLSGVDEPRLLAATGR